MAPSASASQNNNGQRTCPPPKYCQHAAILCVSILKLSFTLCIREQNPKVSNCGVNGMCDLKFQSLQCYGINIIFSLSHRKAKIVKDASLVCSTPAAAWPRNETFSIFVVFWKFWLSKTFPPVAGQPSQRGLCRAALEAGVRRPDPCGGRRRPLR